MFSFKEYLYDFASEETRNKGLKLIQKMLNEDIPNNARKEKIENNLHEIEEGKRDLYF